MVYFFYKTLGGKDGVSQISYTWAHDVRKKTDIITAEIICHENYVPSFALWWGKGTPVRGKYSPRSDDSRNEEI